MGASDIRQELAEYHSYLTLVCALLPQSAIRSSPLTALLREVSDFIQNATSKDIKNRGKDLLQVLKVTVDAHGKVLPRKQTARTIGRDFHTLGSESDLPRFGIPLGWLQERFDAQKLKIAPDLPPHARVGIGIHAGRASVEEEFLLEDTYLLVARAEAAFSRMNAAADSLRGLRSKKFEDSDYRALTFLNREVATLSRLCVVSAAAFVEAFVNSIGWAESARRSDISDETRDQLKGKVKGRYLSLEAKLEKLPKLIRADGLTPIILSDERQAKEPFVSFFAETRELRDASMHYAPGKAMIWHPPQTWIASAQKSTEYATRVAGVFWSACYPDKNPPEYLDGLNHERYLERAREYIKSADGLTRDGA